MRTDAYLIILGYPKIDHEKDYVYFWMPFSLLTIARSVMALPNVEVILFDGNQDAPEKWEELLRAESDRVLFIGLSIMTGGGQIGYALDMAARAKEFTSAPVVFGGPHVNVLPEQTVNHELVDMGLSGPGQTSAPQLVRALRGEITLQEVPGLIKRSPLGYIRGPVNPPRTGQLGGYPWQLLDVERYVRNDPTVARRTLNYVSSQGCAYQCRFCYETSYKRKWSAQPAPALLHDIAHLVERYQLSGIKFYDADWFINLARADAFCEGLISQDIDIRWAASINPNDVLKARKYRPGLLRHVAASGCSRLLMGVESGSDRVLNDLVGKETTRVLIFDVAREIAEYGIMGSYTFIVGFPGETVGEINETYQLIDDLRSLSPLPETRVHLFAPYPGTPLFDSAIAHGFEPPQTLAAWSNYDYYESQTPWTSPDIASRARANTHMVLQPESGSQ